MLKIWMAFAWSWLTGGDRKSAFLKALRNTLMIGGPFAAGWLHAHGVDATVASHFVSNSIGGFVTGVGIIMSVWDWFSVKKQVTAPATYSSSPPISKPAPPDTTGKTVIGKLDAAELASLEAASKN